MPTIGKPKPRFLKFVSKPANVGNVELPTGGASEISDIAGLQAILTDYEDRIAALENAG